METITDTEIDRERYVGQVPGVYGPSVVEVVTYSHVSDTRPVIIDTCSVEVNGTYRYGFPASHGFEAHNHWSLNEAPQLTEIFRTVDADSEMWIEQHANGSLVFWIQLTEAPYTCSMNILVPRQAEALIAALTGQEA